MRLPEEQRLALVLAEIEELDHSEIAEVQGCRSRRPRKRRRCRLRRRSRPPRRASAEPSAGRRRGAAPRR
ncbi:MAG: sigma factor-like helix-turn-helix DNA-binding protein [Thermoleophilaceae bacterium]